MSALPLSVADTVTVLRRRYPDALVCVECGLLLATRRESYAKSDLPEADRLSYVCFECRLDRVEAERVHEVRVEKARHAAQASAEARRLRAARAGDVDINPLPVWLPDPGAEALPIPAVYAGFRGEFYTQRPHGQCLTQPSRSLSTAGWTAPEARHLSGGQDSRPASLASPEAVQ
jgi:hypothetical protein